MELFTVPHREHCTCEAPRGYIKTTLHCGLLHASCAELLPAQHLCIISSYVYQCKALHSMKSLKSCALNAKGGSSVPPASGTGVISPQRAQRTF